MVQQLQTGQHFLPFHRNSSCRLTQECGGGSVWATQTHWLSSCEVDSSGQWKHTRHRQNSVGTENYPTSFCSARFCLCFVSSLSPQIASPPSVFLSVLIWTTCVSFTLLLFPASASPSTSSCVASLFSNVWTSIVCEFGSSSCSVWIISSISLITISSWWPRPPERWQTSGHAACLWESPEGFDLYPALVCSLASSHSELPSVPQQDRASLPHQNTSLPRQCSHTETQTRFWSRPTVAESLQHFGAQMCPACTATFHFYFNNFWIFLKTKAIFAH